ncbi:hypothetical protein [Streptomyces sp. NPDC001657]|uniref:AMP-binding enzyme n=1 Tax=Streptomyces sp. NPDC001657 TaxID=3154522 RepID=UPI00332AD1E2
MVVGVLHPVHGEEVAAVVTLKPHASATAEEIRDHVKARCPPTSTPAWSASPPPAEGADRQDPQWDITVDPVGS